MSDLSTACVLTRQVSERLQNRVTHSIDPESSAAAVLIPVVRAEEPRIVLTRRALHLNSHPGEVAFPGGKRDPEDSSLQAAALRETEEEIGVSPDAVDVVSAMPQVISRFGVTVTPFLGFIDESVTFTPSEEEIESIFTVPIHWLSKQSNVQFQEFPGGQLWPFYNYPDKNRLPEDELIEAKKIEAKKSAERTYRIWGITAKILTNTMNSAFDADLEF